MLVTELSATVCDRKGDNVEVILEGLGRNIKFPSKVPLAVGETVYCVMLAKSGDGTPAILYGARAGCIVCYEMPSDGQEEFLSQAREALYQK